MVKKHIEWMKTYIVRFAAEVNFYRRVIKHPDTPRGCRWLLTLALIYALSPIDIIPDGIPVLGYLDDLIILPFLIIPAIRMVPPHVREECRQTASPGNNQASRTS